MKKTLLIPLFVLLAGCGSFSQARYDDLAADKRNHVQDVQRAQQGKLSAVELRSSLHSYDTQLLAELAHKGKNAGLDKAKQQLESDSDKAVADLFNGDTGR